MILPRVELGDVCEITMGQAPPGESYNNHGFGYALIAGAGDFGVFERPETKRHTSDPTKICKAGDIVLSIRATIGTKVLSDHEYCLGRGVAGLRAKAKLNARYLWHWLTHAEPDLSRKGRGATFPQVSRQDIAELTIPLPSLDEQQRIAAILDKVDAMRRKRKRALSLLEELQSNLFEFEFGSKRWPTLCLSDVVKSGTIVTYGIVQAGPEYDSGVPYIRTGDIVDGRIRVDTLRHTDPLIAARYERSRVRSSDIVMSIRATVGTTALILPELDGANLTQGTARIAPGDKVIPRFLLGFLRSQACQVWIQAQVKGATFREITLSRLRELEVPLPPIAAQERFAQQVLAIERRLTSMRTHLSSLDNGFSSLQHRAFNGQL